MPCRFLRCCHQLRRACTLTSTLTSRPCRNGSQLLPNCIDFRHRLIYPKHAQSTLKRSHAVPALSATCIRSWHSNPVRFDLGERKPCHAMHGGKDSTLGALLVQGDDQGVVLQDVATSLVTSESEGSVLGVTKSHNGKVQDSSPGCSFQTSFHQIQMHTWPQPAV